MRWGCPSRLILLNHGNRNGSSRIRWLSVSVLAKGFEGSLGRVNCRIAVITVLNCISFLSILATLYGDLELTVHCPEPPS
jgi:hypothetical protein